MNFTDTKASTCRYAYAAEILLEGADVIWEHSLAEPQGDVSILAYLPDKRFAYFSWGYGSDGSDDVWLLEGYSADQIVEEMKYSAVYFDKEKEVRNFVDKFTTAYPDIAIRFELWQKSKSIF